MNIEDLKKQRQDKEVDRTKLNALYHQICGQILLLDDMISKLQKENKPSNE